MPRAPPPVDAVQAPQPVVPPQDPWALHAELLAHHDGRRSDERTACARLSLLLVGSAREILAALMVADATTDIAVLAGVYWPAREQSSCIWWSGGSFALSLLCYCWMTARGDCDSLLPVAAALCPVLGGPVAAYAAYSPSEAAVAMMAVSSFPQYLVGVAYWLQYGAEQAPPWYFFLSIGCAVVCLLLLPIVSIIAETAPLTIGEREREAFRVYAAVGVPCVLLELLHFLPVMVEYLVYQGISKHELAAYLAIFNGSKLLLLALKKSTGTNYEFDGGVMVENLPDRPDEYLLEQLLCDSDDGDTCSAEKCCSALFGGFLACMLALTLPLCPATGIAVLTCKEYMENGFSDKHTSQVALGLEHASCSRVSRWNLAVVAIYLLVAYGSMGGMVVDAQRHPPGVATLVLLAVGLVLVVITLLSLTFALPALLVHSRGHWLFSWRDALTLSLRPCLPAVAPAGTLIWERTGSRRLLRLLGPADVAALWPCMLYSEQFHDDPEFHDRSGDCTRSRGVSLPPEVIGLLEHQSKTALIDGLRATCTLAQNGSLRVGITVLQDDPGLVIICPPSCDIMVPTYVRELLLHSPDQLRAVTCMDLVGSTLADVSLAAQADARRRAPLATAPHNVYVIFVQTVCKYPCTHYIYIVWSRCNSKQC